MLQMNFVCLFSGEYLRRLQAREFDDRQLGPRVVRRPQPQVLQLKLRTQVQSLNSQSTQALQL